MNRLAHLLIFFSHTTAETTCSTKGSTSNAIQCGCFPAEQPSRDLLPCRIGLLPLRKKGRKEGPMDDSVQLQLPAVHTMCGSTLDRVIPTIGLHPLQIRLSRKLDGSCVSVHCSSVIMHIPIRTSSIDRCVMSPSCRRMSIPEINLI